MTDHPTPPAPDTDEVDWVVLARFMARESDAAEAEAMEQWLAARPDRQQLVGKLHTLLASQSNAAGVGSGVDVERALRRVHERMASPEVTDLSARRQSRTFAAPPQSWRWPALIGAAAVVALAVGLPSFLNRSQHEAAITAAPRVLRTAVGERDSITLSDGSKVILGPASELTVSANYASGTREVSVRGDAFFEVKHDAAHPFTVRTADAIIQDIGTAFAVHADSGDGVQVSVTEGAVEFRRSVEPASAAVLLRAGDRGTLDATGKVRAHAGGASPDDSAWTTGALVFRDASISKVRADLRRWYGVDLRVADSLFARRHVTASFTRETARQALDVIALALGGTIELRGDIATLKSGPGPTER